MEEATQIWWGEIFRKGIRKGGDPEAQEGSLCLQSSKGPGGLEEKVEAAETGQRAGGQLTKDLTSHF